MMNDISFTSLKNAHNIREYEEKKNHERKRNLLYLIAHYLKEEGYFETINAFTNEAQLQVGFQLCDNVDLPIVLQDFESYYFVRFQKYPKICKKTDADGGIITLHKRFSKNRVARNPVASSESQEAPTATTTTKTGGGKTNLKSHSTTKIPSQPSEKKSAPEISCISVVPLGGDQPVNQATEKIERTLKPLGGLGIHNAEWINMAEIITKEIVVQDLNVRWSDIMGLDEPKRLLKEAVVYPIKYPELFKGILSPWRGLLLFGAPGTGKTLLAKAVATECKTTFFNITASTIVSKWRGDSEKLVRTMFDLARYHAPSTIFLDELDALASKRDGNTSHEHEASRRLKTELLIQLDGLSKTKDQVFFLATSNLPWELDPAILRRLEKRILVDIPNVEAREAMFKHYLPEVVLQNPLLKCDIMYEFLAETTAGYSGSDIRLVCKETAMQAIRKVFQVLENMGSNTNLPKLQLQTITTCDVQKAIEKTKPSASHLIQKYKTWQDQFGSV